MTASENENRAYYVVENYITENKGWVKGSYGIELKRQKDNRLIFGVIHHDDKDSSVVGRGKSIEVHVDINSMRVVDELWSQ